MCKVTQEFPSGSVCFSSHQARAFHGLLLAVADPVWLRHRPTFRRCYECSLIFFAGATAKLATRLVTRLAVTVSGRQEEAIAQRQ